MGRFMAVDVQRVLWTAGGSRPGCTLPWGRAFFEGRVLTPGMLGSGTCPAGRALLGGGSKGEQRCSMTRYRGSHQECVGVGVGVDGQGRTQWTHEAYPSNLPLTSPPTPSTAPYLVLQVGVFKELPLNERASKIASRAIRGDAFMLRSLDDPRSDEWFTPSLPLQQDKPATPPRGWYCCTTLRGCDR